MNILLGECKKLLEKNQELFGENDKYSGSHRAGQEPQCEIDMLLAKYAHHLI